MKKKEFCPHCHKAGDKVELEYRPGRFAHFCAKGHEFTDREELVRMLDAMNAELERPASPPPGPPPGPISIDDINLSRLVSLVGPFGDASTLVGRVFALSQELADAKERAAVALAGAAAPKTAGGDAVIRVRIPERHVQTLTDIAESGGMTLEQFMNIRVEEGADNRWWG